QMVLPQHLLVDHSKEHEDCYQHTENDQCEEEYSWSTRTCAAASFSNSIYRASAGLLETVAPVGTSRIVTATGGIILAAYYASKFLSETHGSFLSAGRARLIFCTISEILAN